MRETNELRVAGGMGVVAGNFMRGWAGGLCRSTGLHVSSRAAAGVSQLCVETPFNWLYVKTIRNVMRAR